MADHVETEDMLTRFAPVPRRKLTVDAYYRMAEAGIIGPDERRIELIEGEIVQMPPIGSDHNATVLSANGMLVMATLGRALVSVQGPVRLDRHNEPQPDLALLRPRPDNYRQAHPGAADVLLLIEVSRSSLPYDRGLKRALYARHGIPEFWIVNLDDKVVEVYRSPTKGAYAETATVDPSGTLTVTALPGVSIQAGPFFA